MCARVSNLVDHDNRCVLCQTRVPSSAGDVSQGHGASFLRNGASLSTAPFFASEEGWVIEKTKERISTLCLPPSLLARRFGPESFWDTRCGAAIGKEAEESTR